MGGTMFGTVDLSVAVMVASVVLATVCLSVVGGILVFGEQRQTNKRMNGVVRRWQPSVAADGTPTLRLAQHDSALPSVDRILKRLLPRREMLRQRLKRTGRSISVGQYFLPGRGSPLRNGDVVCVRVFAARFHTRRLCRWSAFAAHVHRLSRRPASARLHGAIS
jgi:hypothetical protein